jgi:hypothetical protein
VKPPELLELLREFYREKSAMRERHSAGARLVTTYDFNNAYQWVINREDLHLNWLRDAIADFGGTCDDAPEPAEVRASRTAAEEQAAILREDRDAAQAFVDRWRPRIEQVTHARHRNMLRVILGETLEQKRFFDQALEGRDDLLGRHAEGIHRVGAVLPTRWVE